MPNITSAGTYDKSTAGLEQFAPGDKQKALLFAGSSIGTALTVQYLDDTGTARDLENGSITSLPRSMTLQAGIEYQIVTTGSPNFNVTVV